VETGFVFSQKGKVEAIVVKERTIAHRIIEECMLAANVCASRFLHANKVPALYRAHEGPSEEKLKQLRAFLKEFGLKLPGGEKPTAKHFANLIERIKHRPEKTFADHDLALALAGGLSSSQCWPFQPGLRCLYPLYLTHPALSRSYRTSCVKVTLE